MNARFSLEPFTGAPFRDLHPALLAALREHAAWPEPETYDALAASVPNPESVKLPRFVRQEREALQRAGGYERHVATLAAVPTRYGNWHDFFNMVVWAHFPRVRWALNGLHVDPNVGPKDPRNGRARAQNLAATFDESGMIVVSTSPSLLDDLRALRFKRFFWERRDELLATTRFWFVGHGTLESLLTPHPGLATKALLLYVPALPGPGEHDRLRFEIDAHAAGLIDGWRHEQTVLDPVPVLGIPGLCDNAYPEFYDDAQHFRFERQSRRPPALTDPSSRASRAGDG